MLDYNILTPDIELVKTDKFYLFYEMMIQSLKTDNVKEGINKSLELLKCYLQSGHISLFKKNEEGIYIHRISESNMEDTVFPLSCIVNKTQFLSEKKGIVELDLNLSENFENLVLIHVNDNEHDVIVAIQNVNKSVKLEPQFWERTKDTFQIILKRAASYEKNVKAITTDILTGLDNRNSYELRLQNINESDDNIVFALFDLFRLKYINDNYNHAKGDLYIKSAAKILNKYWPKEKKTINDDLTENITNTGHCIYRTGGDEFVLITTVENISLTEIKTNLAAEEVDMICLGLEDYVPIGLNYGLIKHNPGDSIKQTYMIADEKMRENKVKMYAKYNLERRK